MKNFPLQMFKQGVATMVFIFLFSFGALGQSRLQGVSSLPPARTDLDSTLASLMRTAPATDQDLAGVHFGGKMQWLTFWHRNAAHQAQIAAALRRNLQGAVPNLVREVQTSHGSITTSFKLYNDLNVVCESLDSLLPPGSPTKNAEYTSLSNDLSDLNRLREQISAHIQQTAALLESNHTELVSSAGHPKKIIVDDDIPEKPSLKRHKSRQ